MSVQQLSATALQARLAKQEALLLLDVREPDEFAFACIAGSRLIPLQQIPQRIGELDLAQAVVVICHHGIRSQYAADYLVAAGFSKVFNLQGGIDAWSVHCDTGIPRY